MIFRKLRESYGRLSEKVHNWIAGLGVTTATAGGGAAGAYAGGFLGFMGGLVGGAVGLLVAPAYLGIQYLRTKPDVDRFPFTEIKRPEYQATEWFNGRRGPILEGPKMNWFLRPLLRRSKDREGNLESITSREDEQNIPDFRFKTRDNLEGKMSGQYTFQVQSKEDAFKYIWNLEPDRKKKVLDVVVSRIQNEIARIEEGDEYGRDVGDSESFTHRVMARLNYDPDAPENGNDEYRKEKAQESIYSKWGIKIRSISLSEPDFDTKSQEVNQIHIDAQMEAERTAIQAAATLRETETYMAAAKAFLPNGTEQERAEYAMQFLNFNVTRYVSENAENGTLVRLDGLGKVGAGPVINQLLNPLTAPHPATSTTIV